MDMKNALFSSIFLVLFVLLTLSTSTQARLGETIEQCKERYGNPTVKKGEAFFYKKNDIVVKIIYRNGTVYSITYKKEKGTIEKEEIDYLLKVNAGEKLKWNKKTSSFWVLSDKSATAKFETKMNTLEIKLKSSTPEEGGPPHEGLLGF